jgi:hypothetical protein
VQVVLQSPSHLTVHVVESEHVTVLPAPTSSLHDALVLHATTASSPSLKSQSELALHVTVLPSPPCPLHIDESLHVTVSVSLELPSHFDDVVQLSEHALSPHVVLQSWPAAHTHAESVHVQPVPVHVGALLSPPHAASSVTKQSETSDRMIPPRTCSIVCASNANRSRTSREHDTTYAVRSRVQRSYSDAPHTTPTARSTVCTHVYDGGLQAGGNSRHQWRAVLSSLRLDARA